MTEPAGRPQIGVFGRWPCPGRVKTRLARALGEEAASRLYAAFLADTLAAARAVAPGGVWLFVAPDPPHDVLVGVDQALEPALLPPPSRRVLQTGDDLGARMAHALATMLARGPALVLGSDAPDLPRATLRQAFGALVGSDLVLGPSADGGFYLAGATRAVGDVFESVAWSSGQERAQTIARAEARGLAVGLLEPWWDVDDAAGLEALRGRLAAAHAHGAPVPERTISALATLPPVS